MTHQAAERGPTTTVDESVGLDALTEEILPALIARLRASRLGELEVRSQGWRVRLRRDPGLTSRRTSRSSTGEGGPSAADDDAATGVARSPAVGYFSPAPLLVVGRAVQAGDQLGSVDVLGISHELMAPLGGIISAVLAEAGQAVEYGQPLASIDPLEPVLPDDDPADGEAVTAHGATSGGGSAAVSR